jgi:AraC-like DNA-binding protein
MPTTSWLSDPSLRVVGWRCPGGAGAPAAGAECPEVHELFIARRGAHARRLGPARELVADSSVIACAPAGEAYRIVGRTGGEERATVRLVGDALLRDALAAAGAPGADAGRVRLPPAAVPLCARAALAHDALVRAARDRDAVRVHEAALALVRHATAPASAAAGGDRASPRASPRARRAAVEARLLLAARSAEPLTLAGVAAAVGLSAWQLSRAYRATFGAAVHAHLRDLRLDGALERMREGGGALSPIALAVGFSSHSHFTSAFRARFGTTPSAHAARRAARHAAG